MNCSAFPSFLFPAFLYAFVITYFGTKEISRDPVLTRQDEREVLQVREQEVLAGPQIAHSRSRCVWAGTQLVDHLREGDNDRNTQTRKKLINEMANTLILYIDSTYWV